MEFTGRRLGSSQELTRRHRRKGPSSFCRRVWSGYAGNHCHCHCHYYFTASAGTRLNCACTSLCILWMERSGRSISLPHRQGMVTVYGSFSFPSGTQDPPSHRGSHRTGFPQIGSQFISFAAKKIFLNIHTVGQLSSPFHR